MTLRKPIAATMRRIREGRLPSSEAVVEMSFQELGYQPGNPHAEEVRKYFNCRLRQVFEHTLVVLERFENDAYAHGIPDEIIAQRQDAFTAAEEAAKCAPTLREGLQAAFRVLFADLYPLLREMFLSISQSRKARGGKDFELEFGKLLEHAGIPYQKVSRQTRTDFMVPSDRVFASNRNVALVISAKRTLRERWREVAEELFNLRSPNVYLVTADEDISQGHVQEICGQYNIHLVVWDELKSARYPGHPLVIGYSQLLNEVIPMFEQRWNMTRRF